MGSFGAMEKGSADRYFQEDNTAACRSWCPGHRGRVPTRARPGGDPPADGRPAFVDGYVGCADIPTMRKAEFVRSPRPAWRESTCTTCRSPRKRRTTSAG